MRTMKPGQRAHVGALDVIAHDHTRYLRISRAELFDVGQLRTERIDPIRNQREQNPVSVVREQTIDGTGQVA